MAGLGPGSGSMASYGSYGLPGGPMASVASGATGFTSAPSWSSVQGMHGLHPAASTGSTYSAGYGDPFGQAVAAAGLAGVAAGVPAAAMGSQHQPPAAAGSIGFDDAAFAPADDWRVLGDVQQWYRTLLTKEKVGGGCCSWAGAPLCPYKLVRAGLASSGAANTSKSSHAPHGDWLACACHTQGILYEDTALQVGLQSRYVRSTGELLLFLGNKQAGQPLSGVSLVVSAPSPAVQVVLGQPPAQLAPKQQVQVGGELTVCLVHRVSAQLLSQACSCSVAGHTCTRLRALLFGAMQVLAQVTCLQPFQEPPRLQLRYSVGARQVVQDLPLPLAPHKFMVPEPHIAKEAFFDKWKSYAGEAVHQSCKPGWCLLFVLASRGCLSCVALSSCY